MLLLLLLLPLLHSIVLSTGRTTIDAFILCPASEQLRYKYKGTMDPEGSARNSCNSGHAAGMLWPAVTAVAFTPAVYAN